MEFTFTNVKAFQINSLSNKTLFLLQSENIEYQHFQHKTKENNKKARHDCRTFFYYINPA